MKENLLDLYLEVYKRDNKIRKLFRNWEEFDFIIDKLSDIILTQFKIPEDNTKKWSDEEIQKFGETDTWPKEFFCRDHASDLLYEYADGKITKTMLLKKLKKLQQHD